IPASFNATRAADSARSAVDSPSAATRRRSIPVRVRIHSSSVSTSFDQSSFVMILSGTYPPKPRKPALLMRPERTPSTTGTQVEHAAVERQRHAGEARRSGAGQVGDGGGDFVRPDQLSGG